MDWTEQQARAINSRDKNLLVAAAAGSGKTAVLVERITKLAIEEENFDVDRMLIVTFTNAAAQEMRTRIYKKFLSRMEQETDPTLLAKIERQSILLSGSSITTFHAFCLSVLRRHFAKIDLDPKLREANEHELAILRQEVLEKLFEEKYQADDEHFNKFTDNFGGNMQGDSALYKSVLDLYDFAQSRPYPEKWLQSLVDSYENPATFKLDSGETWFEIIMKSAAEEVGNIIEGLYAESLSAKELAAAQIISDKTLAKNWSKVVSIFEDDVKIFSELKKAAEDWDKLRDALASEKNFARFPSLQNLGNLQAVKQKIQSMREDYKEKLKTLYPMVTLSKEEIFAETLENAEPVRRLVELTLDFEKAFSAAKRERGIIDFNDMEHLALKIFNADESTARSYREKFKVVMVDEYQDTNDVQEEIISKVAGVNNFFAVGDVKQSIYKFRNAAPEIFLKKYKTYPDLPDCERIDLSKNFRSRRQVVEAVNSLFRRLMTEDAMEIDYNKDAELNFGASYPDAENIFDEKAELIIVAQEKSSVKKTSEDDADDEAESLGRFEVEIQIIADKIKSMMDSGKKIFDKDAKAYRALEFKDIVILLRATEGKATKTLDILHANNIPAYAEDKGGYFRAKEIQTIISLLNVLDNARQDIPLAAVMLSPIGGFSAEDLARLRLDDRDNDLYTLLTCGAMGDDEFSAQCKNFLLKINAWRELARQVSVPELLSTIYRETGYYDYFDNAAGRVAQANLRVLIDRAAEFESTAFRGLSRFIQFVKKIRELGNDLSAARTLGENENVVRVMTVHKSKGLEFPVVFVADLGKRFNTKDLSEPIIANRSLGIGICKTVEGNAGLERVPTLARRVVDKKNRAENQAEELRILYVALTRAREKLVLVGTCNKKNLDKYADSAALEKISKQKLQSANTALEWLLMAKDEKFFDIEICDEVGAVKKSVEVVEVEEEKISQAVEKAASSVLENIPAKLSVTEIKRRLNDAEENLQVYKATRPALYRKPSFIQKSSVTGAEFGTLMHGVIQRLDLQQKLDAENISAQIEEMICQEIFTEEQGEILKAKSANIERFFSSAIGRKILSAKKIYRELPFSQYIDAATIQTSTFAAAQGEKVFIQGIIDLLFEDSAGNWILLDYKTDRNNSDEHFQREYREQINFYVRAMEMLLNLKIQEKYLYLLGAGRLIEM